MSNLCEISTYPMGPLNFKFNVIRGACHCVCRCTPVYQNQESGLMPYLGEKLLIPHMSISFFRFSIFQNFTLFLPH